MCKVKIKAGCDLMLSKPNVLVGKHHKNLSSYGELKVSDLTYHLPHQGLTEPTD